MSEIAKLSSALSGRYAIERELGRGGMATVYLANDLKHLARRDPSVTTFLLSNILSEKLRRLPEFVGVMDDLKMPGWKPGAPGWPAGRAALP